MPRPKTNWKMQVLFWTFMAFVGLSPLWAVTCQEWAQASDIVEEGRSSSQKPLDVAVVNVHICQPGIKIGFVKWETCEMKAYTPSVRIEEQGVTIALLSPGCYGITTYDSERNVILDFKNKEFLADTMYYYGYPDNCLGN